jgi:hypothetical protein
LSVTNCLWRIQLSLDSQRKLRDRLAKKLGMPDVPGPVWDNLIEEGYVRDASEGSEEQWQDLLGVAKSRLKL